MKNYSNCPICNNTTFTKTRECLDHTVSKKKFTIVECNKCTFQFTNPIPLENEIGSYYESEEYVSHSNTKKGLIFSLYQMVRNKTLSDKLKLIKSNSNAETILDIGSGTGEFLNICKKNGIKVRGIEPSKQARNFAIENYNLTVDNEDNINNIANESIDAITMWHVLEHVYNLNIRIEAIKRILKKEGTLFVAVPNRNSYDAEKYKNNWAAYDVPRHLYHFTPNDIKTLFEKHGFTVEQILPMKFDSYYVSMLSEKCKTGKINYLNAFLNGAKSNWKASNKKDNSYSSQIYILRKQKN